MAMANGITYKDAQILSLIAETKTVEFQIKKDVPRKAQVVGKAAEYFKTFKKGVARIGLSQTGDIAYFKNAEENQKTLGAESVQIPKKQDSPLAMPMSISESSAIEAPIKKSSANKKLYAFKFALEFLKLSGQKPQTIEEIKKIASEIELCI